MSFAEYTDWILSEGWLRRNEALPTRARVAAKGQRNMEVLFAAVDARARAQTQTLRDYTHIASTSVDPVIDLVVRLIQEDEQRHHLLLARIAASLQDALDWSHSPEALPSTNVAEAVVDRDLWSMTRLLAEGERRDVRSLRSLAREFDGISDGLHTLLLDMMRLDSEKHSRLLQFITRRLEAAVAMEQRLGNRVAATAPRHIARGTSATGTSGAATLSAGLSSVSPAQVLGDQSAT